MTAPAWIPAGADDALRDQRHRAMAEAGQQIAARVPDYYVRAKGEAYDYGLIQRVLDKAPEYSTIYYDGQFTVNDTLVPKNDHLTHVGTAKITQRAAQKKLFNIAGRSYQVFDGLHLAGLGTDYDDTDSSLAVGVWTFTSGAFNHIWRCHFTNFGYCAYRLTDVTDSSAYHNTIVGPPTLGATDEKNYGILLERTTRCSIGGGSVSATGQGVISQYGVDLTIEPIDVHDIATEHGWYIGAGHRNCRIATGTTRDIPLIGFKIQCANGAGDDNENIVVYLGPIHTTGSHGFHIGSASPGGAGRNRHIDVWGAPVTDAAGDGYNFNSMDDFDIHCGPAYSAGENGVKIGDYMTNGTVHLSEIDSPALCGWRDGSVAATGIRVLGGKGRTIATANTAGQTMGAILSFANGFEVDGWAVEGAAGNMTYTVYIQGTNSQAGFRCRNVSGPAPFRSDNAATTCTEWANNFFAGINTNPPVPPTIASAAAITLPFYWREAYVSGTTAVTSITGETQQSGKDTTLIATNAAGFTLTNGNNIRHATAVVPQYGTVTVWGDGTNFY